MADTFTPPIPPQEGPPGNFKLRIRKAQFGEGYTQRVKDGINNRSQVWPFTFVGTNAEIEPIKDFFEAHDGDQSFYYTPPFSSVPVLFTVEEFTLTPYGAENASISANFQQAFAP